MKIVNYKVPKSSFLSVDKDTAKIMDLMLKNDRLKRLLYRTGKDPVGESNLTEQESVNLIVEQWIRNVPKITVDTLVLNYIIIGFDNFQPSGNPEFRDNVISIDVICHFDQWDIKDFQLRPYRIAAEIDSMLDKKRFSGIGVLNFIGANQILLNEEFGGLTLMYAATHGEDDKKGFENPENEELFIKEFAEMVDNNSEF